MSYLVFILLILGFILLVKGADFLVSGASSLAARFGVSQIVIGLTIVSFGTSAPELFVNILASIEGSSDITIGNVVGSNIANILLILGVAGIIYPIHTKKNTIWREIPFALLAAIVLLVLVNDSYFSNSSDLISRGDGIILLLFFLVFMSYIFSILKEGSDTTIEIKELTIKKASLLILAGFIGLIIGGKLIVDSAVKIAVMLNVSEAVIGFTIIAIGTSLPELATSAMAAYRKNSDMAIGNVIGSNIFNIFLILGISAVVNPIAFSQEYSFDLIFMTSISFLLFIVMFTGKRRIIDRWEAVIFIILYIAYIVRLLF